MCVCCTRARSCDTCVRPKNCAPLLRIAAVSAVVSVYLARYMTLSPGLHVDAARGLTKNDKFAELMRSECDGFERINSHGLCRGPRSSMLKSGQIQLVSCSWLLLCKRLCFALRLFGSSTHTHTLAHTHSITLS